ncbi:MAG TPA: ATP-binding protein [Longimicrobiales bacterium]|nr:ATP-binding protein [Longimicrobiales bacterium]
MAPEATIVTYDVPHTAALVRPSTWMARVPVAFVLVSLLGLLVVPIPAKRTTTSLRDEIANVVEPAQRQVAQLQFALTLQVAAVRGFLLTGNPAGLERLREMDARERAAMLALAPLIERLGPDVQAHFAAVWASERQWSTGVTELTAGAITPREYIERTSLQDAHLESMLAELTGLQTALSDAASELLRQTARTERLELGLVLFLGLLALTSSMVVLRMFRRAEAAGTEVRLLNTSLERRVRERTTELEAANRELEAFSYSVSHDLRSPLRSMDGFSQALAEDYGDRLDAEGLDHLRRIRAASQRMGHLIDDLLQISRVTRADMRREQVDLSMITQSVAAALARAEPERNVAFVATDGLTGVGDPALLRIALENLLANAWKFTSRREYARVEFGAARQNGSVAYFVADNGAGFDMTYAGKLFTPFQRLHALTEYPGTGIGLATVQRIVHRHGGSVWAEGTVDNGATFYFTLHPDEGPT